MADSAASNSAFVFAAAYLGTRAPRARPFIAIHAAQEPEGRRRAPSSRLEERRHTALLQCLTKHAS